METFLLVVRIVAHLGAFWMLISYQPLPGSRYRPLISALSVLMAGASLALAFDAVVMQAWTHQYLVTAAAVLLFAALLRCHGNVADLMKAKR